MFNKDDDLEFMGIGIAENEYHVGFIHLISELAGIGNGYAEIDKSSGDGFLEEERVGHGDSILPEDDRLLGGQVTLLAAGSPGESAELVHQAEPWISAEGLG